MTPKNTEDQSCSAVGCDETPEKSVTAVFQDGTVKHHVCSTHRDHINSLTEIVEETDL